MGHHKLKTVQKHLFQRRSWFRIIFEKSHRFAPLDPVDPFGHPPFGLEYLACRSLVGLGIGV